MLTKKELASTLRLAMNVYEYLPMTSYEEDVCERNIEKCNKVLDLCYMEGLVKTKDKRNE